MTPQQRQLVLQSWRQLSPDAERLAELFYSRLFDLAPQLRHLFRGDMTLQQKRLATMLGALVADLEKREVLGPTLNDLGQRHATYGVHEEDFEVFGEALVWALQRVLWGDCTPDVEEAWRAVYREIATAMKAAASRAS
jgi:hemoglobin-like flavoprotein